MPCYHPLVGIFDGKYNENGKKVFKIEGKLVPSEVKIMHPGSVTIPCGRCIGCRLDYSRSWADRMMLEMESCDRKAIFLTLTYNNSHGVPCMVSDYEAGENEYFPQDGLVRLNGDKAYLCEAFTLYKRDVQLFMKRLRKHFKERKIRFYAAGEYGDHTFRPHYHIQTELLLRADIFSSFSFSLTSKYSKNPKSVLCNSKSILSSAYNLLSSISLSYLSGL